MSDNDTRKSLEPWLYDSVNFYPHQIEGIRHLWPRRSHILGDDMGLGKSLQALTVFAMDVISGRAQTCLIVCPISLKGNWADEIEKFTSFNYMTLGVRESKRKPGKLVILDNFHRNEQILDFMAIEGPKILIANYEQIEPHQKILDRMKFDFLISDEAHFLKNPESKRTQAVKEVHTKRSLMLTGTPLLNRVDELWSMLNRVSPKEFPNYWKFRNRYCVFGGYKDKSIVATKNEGELREKLHQHMLRRLKEDVLDLPEVQYVERRVNLLPEQQKLYDEVEDELRLTRFDLEEPQDIGSALTKFLRQKQICGTTVPFMEEDFSGKLDLVQTDAFDLTLREGHKIVVFTQFRNVLEAFRVRLENQYTLAKTNIPIIQLHGDIPKEIRSEEVKRWGNIEGPSVLLCMIQVAGIGLNMTQARHILRIDKLFVPGLNQQGVDRCHRIGADLTQPVQVFDYITRNTVENRVEAILRTKVKLGKDIVDSGALTDFKKKLIAALLERDED